MKNNKAMSRKSTEHIVMDAHKCVACWECIGKCPKNVIGKIKVLWHKHAVFKNPDACIGCGLCIKTCPNGVFRKIHE